MTQPSNHSPLPWSSEGPKIFAADGTVVCEISAHLGRPRGVIAGWDTDIANTYLVEQAPAMASLLDEIRCRYLVYEPQGDFTIKDLIPDIVSIVRLATGVQQREDAVRANRS